MYTYRIVLDAYDSRNTAARGARVVLYVQGHNRDSAFARIRTVAIDTAGRVFPSCSRDDGWIGTNNMPHGDVTARTLPEWTVVSIRAVKAAGKSRVLAE